MKMILTFEDEVHFFIIKFSNEFVGKSQKGKKVVMGLRNQKTLLLACTSL